MPQMAPLWWELLFSLFTILFTLMMIMIYFMNQPKINKNKMFNQMNWKW